MRDLSTTLGIIGSGLWRGVRPALRWGLRLAGALMVLMVLLAFTRLPFEAHRWLGMACAECSGPVASIVVLGGSGMPSGPELLRLHKAAELANDWPRAGIVIVHPGQPSVLSAMADELVLRGVDPGRIERLNAGENTREQALLLGEEGKGKPGAVAIVTAPENIRRSVLAFRKAGAELACGAGAWEHAMDHGFRYNHDRIGGRPWLPDVAGRPSLRYTFWNYLKLEVTCLREWIALAYYRMNGWI